MLSAAILACNVHVPTPSLEIFPETVSPKKKFAVMHSASKKNEDVNTLINLDSYKPIAVLKGFSGFANENHGGMFASYSKMEDYAVVMQAGKWEPRALAVVSTQTGKQADLLKSMKSAMKTYLTKHGKKGDQFVFDVSGAQFSGNKATLFLIGEVPKQEIDAVYAAYTFDVSNLKLSAPSVVLQTVQQHEKSPSWAK